MAQIEPFRALRYRTDRAGPIETLVCPPYDVISGEQRAALLAQNPYNVVRLELPQEGGDPYETAGETLSGWLSQGVLQPDMDEGVYLYEMEYLTEIDRGEPKKLLGMFARVQLEDFENGVVLPHENTLKKAKEDRFQLMKATGCNFSGVYCLYQDEGHSTRRRLLNLKNTCAPRYDFSDGLVTHRLWVVNDVEAIEALRHDFADRKLYIADGHHRYETALRYRDSCREQGTACPGSESVMMFLADMADEGLTVFPTHRLVRGLEGFGEEELLAACGEDFEVSPCENRREAEGALSQYYREGKHAFGFFAGNGWHVLALRDVSRMDALLPQECPALRRLDVTILHSLVLEDILGIDRENMAAQRNLTYTRSAGEAEQSVRAGESQCCFLLNPTRVEEIGEVAAAGGKMPQKSTYFYPKLITGLVMNRLEV